ncbi:unnamed protein product [Ascophyllum nodosum]
MLRQSGGLPEEHMSLIASAFVILGHQSHQRLTSPASASFIIFPQPIRAQTPSPLTSLGFGQASLYLDRIRSWEEPGALRTFAFTRVSRVLTGQSGAVEGDDVGNGSDRVRREARSLQERLKSLRLELSLGKHGPHSAGAPRREVYSLTSSAVEAASKQPAAARHSLYVRRKRPPSALCMPRHQRPQGCAPLLPIENQHAVVDHIVSQQMVRAKLSDFKSDLPCVQNGTCPVPAFRCPKGHVWTSKGKPECFYCPVCADSRVTPLGGERRQKRDLEVMKELAEARGGMCISKTYRGMHGKIRFRCAEGHEWLSSPSNIAYKKTWCPICAGSTRSERKRLNVAEMHRTARQFGGEFLSEEYLGAAVKHEWKCHRGHRFWQAPNNVRRSEGGRRTATFCKKCTIIDKGIIRATLLGGLDPETAKRTEAELSSIGAMPTRRHFLPRKRKFNKIRRATSKGGGRSA